MKKRGAGRVLRAWGIGVGATVVFLGQLLSVVNAATTIVSGATAGNFAVSPSGAATYSVPIIVPPGIAGMQPELALSYNSQSGTGTLGEGWSVSGLSSITRCPQTQAQDNNRGVVSLDANDRFCLDGQRLINVSGEYGANGTSYRTEIESFAKITSYDEPGTSGPAYFIVKTKDGKMLEYGKMPDQYHSRIKPGNGPKGNAVIVWALNKITDIKGNYLTITYESFGWGEYHPVSIDYTGTNTFGPNNSVRFFYTTTDFYTLSGVEEYYVGGSLLKSGVLLSSIATYVGPYSSVAPEINRVKTYSFSYESLISGRTRLTNIIECAGNGTTCLTPIGFSWSSIYMGAAGSSAAPVSVVPACAQCGPWLADINGDGKADLVWIGSGNYIKWAYATGADNPATNQMGVAFSSAQTGPQITLPSTPNFMLGDINADGLADLVWNDSSSGAIYYSRSSALGFEGQQSATVSVTTDTGGGPWLADVNGDSRQDLVWLRKDNSTIAYATASGNGFDAAPQTGIVATTTNLQPVNINDDGLIDLVWLDSSNHINYSLSTGTGFSVAPPTSVTVTSNVSGGHLYMADVNGDGKSDAVWFYDNGNGQVTIYNALSSGNSFDTAQSFASTMNSFGGIVGVVDATGDGLADVLWLSVTTSSRYPVLTCKAISGYACQNSSASYFNFGSAIPANSVTADKVWPADINGDASADLVWIDSNGAVNYTLSTYQGNKIVRIVSRPSITITYKSLTDPRVDASDVGAVYQRDTDAVNPLQDYQQSMYVVSNYIVDSGAYDPALVGTDVHINYISNRYNYQYAGGKLDLNGRGLLGFRQVTVSDPQTNTVTTTNYRLDFPYIGSPASIVSTVNGKEISRATNLYASVSNDTAPIVSIPVTYLSRSELTVTDYDDRDFITQTITENTLIDQYGNVKNSIVTVKDGKNNVTLSTQATVAEYLNDTTQWILGLPTIVNTRTEGANAQVVTKTAGTIYRSSDRFPQTVLVEPATYDPNTGVYTVGCNTLVTDYDYDVYGNRKSTTVSGGSIGCITASGATIDTTVVSRTTTDTWTGLETATPTLVSKNAAGHSETKVIDGRFGVVTNLTGPNGLVTAWGYDAFGRKILETRPGGTTTSWTYCLAGTDKNTTCYNSTLIGSFVFPPGTNSYVIVQVSDGSHGVTYNDMLGREVRTETTALDGSTIYRDTLYNRLGKISRSLNPSYAFYNPVYDYYASLSMPGTTYQYDPVGRVKQQIVPSPAGASLSNNTLTSTIATATVLRDPNAIDSNNAVLLARQVTDANGHSTVNYTDQLGRAKKIKDANNSILSFEHDVVGNPTRTTDPAGNVIEFSYDISGRKVKMVDPDLGTWYYAYNAIGELIWQQDGLNQITTMAYDKLGRMISRNEADFQSNWVYDTANMGIGKIANVGASNGFQRAYAYDNLGRPSTATTTIDQAHIVRTTYDAQARVDTVTYPTGFAVKHEYSTYNGALKRIYNPVTNTNFWQATVQDALGHITGETLGATINTSYGYDQASGALTNITTATLQNQSYSYDNVGNLKNRTDSTYNLGENYEYDSLNRIQYVKVGGTIVKSVNYDAIGNITYKSDVGTYIYGLNTGAPGVPLLRPHSVTGITPVTNSLLPIFNAVYTYSSFNMPLRYTQTRTGGTYWSEFNYDADHNRVKQTDSAGKTTIYLLPGSNGVHYEKSTQNGVTTHTHYLYGGGQMIGEYVTKSDSSQPVTRYFLRDQLGSIVRAVSDGGALIECLSYDIWGKRRNCNGSDDTTNTLAGSNTNRGFTDHEHLDNLDLVHMNGRIYDPITGRFLTADPYLQAPGNLQSYNRFSYVINNPLSATDPSGYRVCPWCQERLHAAGNGIENGIKKAATDFIQLQKIWYGSAIVAAPVAAGFIIGGPEGAVAAAKGEYDAYKAYKNGASVGQSLLIGTASGLETYGAIVTLESGYNAFTSSDSLLGNALGGAEWGGHHYMNQMAREDIARYVHNHTNLSLTQFNLALFGISMMGDSRMVNQGNGKVDIHGWLYRSKDIGALSVVFDLTDTILGYQGLPTSTAIDYLFTANGADIVSHSLGTLDAANLAAFGVTGTVQLNSLPFLNVAPNGVEVRLNGGDFVNGFYLGSIFNPSAEMLHVAPTTSNVLGHGSKEVYGLPW